MAASNLLSKPETCAGCPLYGDGRGYVPDELVDGAPVLVVAQNPGEYEELGRRVTQRSGRSWQWETQGPAPLIGPTGYEMERTYFPVAGLERGVNVSLANLLKCRYTVHGKRTNDMPTGEVYEMAVRHCTEAHLRIPPSTRLIVAMGAHAARHFGMQGSISEWRGFLLPRRGND